MPASQRAHGPDDVVQPWCLIIKARDLLEELECAVCEERDDTPDHLRPNLKQRLTHRNHCRGFYYRSDLMNEAVFVDLCRQVWPRMLGAEPDIHGGTRRLSKTADHPRFEVWGAFIGDELEDTYFKSILIPKRYVCAGVEKEYAPWREFQRALRQLVAYVELKFKPALPAIYMPATAGRLVPIMGRAGTEAWFKEYRKENFREDHR